MEITIARGRFLKIDNAKCQVNETKKENKKVKNILFDKINSGQKESLGMKIPDVWYYNKAVNLLDWILQFFYEKIQSTPTK